MYVFSMSALKDHKKFKDHMTSTQQQWTHYVKRLNTYNSQQIKKRQMLNAGLETRTCKTMNKNTVESIWSCITFDDGSCMHQLSHLIRWRINTALMLLTNHQHSQHHTYTSISYRRQNRTTHHIRWNLNNYYKTIGCHKSWQICMQIYF